MMRMGYIFYLNLVDFSHIDNNRVISEINDELVETLFKTVSHSQKQICL